MINHMITVIAIIYILFKLPTMINHYNKVPVEI